MDGICNCLYNALQGQLSNLDSILNSINSQSDVLSGGGTTGTMHESLQSLNNTSHNTSVSETSVVMLTMITLGIAALVILRNNTERQTNSNDYTEKVRYNSNNNNDHSNHRYDDHNDGNAT